MKGCEDRDPSRASFILVVIGVNACARTDRWWSRQTFVVVANRLPVTSADEDGRRVWQSSSGGLVSALVPVLRERDGVWVGWSGVPDGSDAPRQFEGITLSSVSISTDEYESFYLGFANRTLWPLYHDAIRTPTFDRRWWQAYVDVNRRYADAAAEVAAPGAIVWVHDYHLQLVPMLLRERRPDLRIGFFLHIPFPPRELFMQLPWRRQILEGMLGADLIGFQVPGAASNFTHLARRLLGVAGREGLLRHEDRVVRVGAFPISIDTADLIGRATTPTVVERAARSAGSSATLSSSCSAWTASTTRRESSNESKRSRNSSPKTRSRPPVT